MIRAHLHARNSSMPLTELMNYFNDQLQTQSRASALPKNGFFKLNNGFSARFGSLLIHPHFQKIIYRSEYLYGIFGDLTVRSITGNRINLDDIYLSLDSREQIVHLDRLSRTLLSLNFLQHYDRHQVKLFLPVHPRHIASIDENHGKTFEVILSDCGLGPNRVVLYTNFNFDIDLNHFDRALSSYRDKGYSIGINIKSAADIEKLTALNLASHYAILDYAILDSKFVSDWNTFQSNQQSKKIEQIKPIVINTETSWSENNADLQLVSQLDEEQLTDMQLL
jgi:hypothetical protein